MISKTLFVAKRTYKACKEAELIPHSKAYSIVISECSTRLRIANLCFHRNQVEKQSGPGGGLALGAFWLSHTWSGTRPAACPGASNKPSPVQSCLSLYLFMYLSLSV